MSYPATSPYVVAVGGTSLSHGLQLARLDRVGLEHHAGTEGTGSGCSAYDAKPAWQTDTAGCSKRTDNDVSAVADPNTGVAVYDTSNGNGGWNEVGGTSASSPMIAAMYALAGNRAAAPRPTTSTPTPATSTTSPPAATARCSPAYLCTAETGYDGPTGLGTPNGIAAWSARQHRPATP